MSGRWASQAVFVNCPFDNAYKPLFDAICFAIAACGLTVRSALEIVDSGEVRLEKIYRLIESCAWSIHDLSRVELDGDSGLPRFNMPIELGIALGFRRYARRKVSPRVLVLDSERYRYQQFASDLAGVDTAAHANDPETAIAKVRNFLNGATAAPPSPSIIIEHFRLFESALPALAKSRRQQVTELTFVDRLRLVELYLASR